MAADDDTLTTSTKLGIRQSIEELTGGRIRKLPRLPRGIPQRGGTRGEELASLGAAAAAGAPRARPERFAPGIEPRDAPGGVLTREERERERGASEGVHRSPLGTAHEPHGAPREERSQP